MENEENKKYNVIYTHKPPLLKSEDLTFSQFSSANLAKTDLNYHPLNEWGYTDWACAAAGEMGELLNEIKKVRRRGETPELTDSEKAKIAHEVYDTFVYLDLLVQRLGMNMCDILKEQWYENNTEKALRHLVHLHSMRFAADQTDVYVYQSEKVKS